MWHKSDSFCDKQAAVNVANMRRCKCLNLSDDKCCRSSRLHCQSSKSSILVIAILVSRCISWIAILVILSDDWSYHTPKRHWCFSTSWSSATIGDHDVSSTLCDCSSCIDVSLLSLLCLSSRRNKPETLISLSFRAGRNQISDKCNLYWFYNLAGRSSGRR